jgi:hypothetical protein
MSFLWVRGRCAPQWLAFWSCWLLGACGVSESGSWSSVGAADTTGVREFSGFALRVVKDDHGQEHLRLVGDDLPTGDERDVVNQVLYQRLVQADETEGLEITHDELRGLGVPVDNILQYDDSIIVYGRITEHEANQRLHDALTTLEGNPVLKTMLHELAASEPPIRVAFAEHLDLTPTSLSYGEGYLYMRAYGVWPDASIDQHVDDRGTTLRLNLATLELANLAVHMLINLFEAYQRQVMDAQAVWVDTTFKMGVSGPSVTHSLRYHGDVADGASGTKVQFRGVATPDEWRRLNQLAQQVTSDGESTEDVPGALLGDFIAALEASSDYGPSAESSHYDVRMELIQSYLSLKNVWRHAAVRALLNADDDHAWEQWLDELNSSSVSDDSLASVVSLLQERLPSHRASPAGPPDQPPSTSVLFVEPRPAMFDFWKRYIRYFPIRGPHTADLERDAFWGRTASRGCD